MARNEEDRTKKLKILYPPTLTVDAVRTDFMQLATKEQSHKIRAMLCLGLVPITSLATLLPGPNVFLAYNLYRLYGHYNAWKGCAYLNRAEIQFIETSELAGSGSACAHSPSYAEHVARQFDFPHDDLVDFLSRVERESIQPQANKEK